MIINKVEIENFKIYEKETFIFEDAKAILLTGDNGFGKTTVMDAIEWCLSGSMGRIKTAYNIRHRKKTEKNRKENNEGIIKNRHASKYDKICVTVEIKYNDEKFRIIRKQTDDKLDTDSELTIINSNGDNVPVERFEHILQYFKNAFYQMYVCDSDKTARFFDKSRQELREAMSDFIEPNEQAEQVVNLLEQEKKYLEGELNDKLQGYKEKNRQKIDRNKEIIKNLMDSGVHNLINMYPQEKVYEEEILEIDSLQEEEINKQLKCICDVVNSKCKQIATTLKEQLELEQELFELNKLKKDCVTNKDLFEKVIEKKYFDDTTKEDIKKNIHNLQSEKSKFNSIFQSDNFEIEAKEICQNEKSYHILEILKMLKNKILSLQSNIHTMEEGNELLQAMSNLVADKNAYIQYKKDGNTICPLCGSTDGFMDTEDKEICEKAQVYIDERNEELAILKIELRLKENCYNTGKKQFQDMLLSEIAWKEKQYNEEKRECDELTKILQVSYDSMKKYNVELTIHYLDSLDDVVKEKKSRLMESDKIDEMKNELKELFSIIEYKDYTEGTKEELERFILSIDQANIDFIKVNCTNKILNKKVVALKSVKNNTKLKKCKSKIKEYEVREEIINNFIGKNEDRIADCNHIKNQLQEAVNEFENEQLKNVGNCLYSIFQKLVKHSSIKKFQYNSAKTVTNDAGAVFQDESGKNIFNILSHGQLSVFMLSYFIANMFRIKNKVDFHTYFYDDMTNYLDDMNQLTFIDFLKYQLAEKNGAMEQLFFATCNREIEELLVHKFKNYDIPIINFKFESSAKYTVLH